MKLWLRLVLYVGGGGLIITWIDPPGGFTRSVLILVVIVGAAYCDLWLSRPRQPKWQGQNVISLTSVRRSRKRRQASGGSGRERRVLQTVYSSGYHQEVDELLGLLRAEGLNPIMVAQNRSRGGHGPIYDVRLPEKEVAKAKPLIQFFLVKTAKRPS